MGIKQAIIASAVALLPLAACAAGDSAPLLSTALQGLDGRAHRIDEWNGKIRLINFWATWCAPCRQEMPLLDSVRKEWRSKGVEVIGVAVDAGDDVRAFASAAKIAYPMLIAQDEGFGLMQAGGNAYGALPFTLLLDRNGKVVQRHAGVLDANRLKQWLGESVAAH
ncbi:TlpA family protein disulfide reductase [Herbaspirillum sp. HC18]|nr:TlpA family protein disulfide reductase [Herbaspirillum sp. HC18]